MRKIVQLLSGDIFPLQTALVQKLRVGHLGNHTVWSVWLTGLLNFSGVDIIWEQDGILGQRNCMPDKLQKTTALCKG